MQNQADLFVEDEERLTPCDHAERQQHTELALSLESQMVFSSSTSSSAQEAHADSSLIPRKEVRLRPPNYNHGEERGPGQWGYPLVP